MLSLAARLIPKLRAYPARVPDGFLYVDVRDVGQAGYLFSEVIPHERGLWSLMSCIARRDDCFWDVGAHCGFYATALASPRFGLSAIHAFEPNPNLHANLARQERVVLHRVALGERQDWLDLKYSKKGASAVATLRPSRETTVARVCVETAASQLDMGVPHPDVLKIDVEGFELSVLKGFGDRLGTPLVFMEYIDWMAKESGWQLADLRSFLGTDWRIFRIENDGSLRSTEVDKPKTTNDILLVHSSRLDRIHGVSIA